jgi:hypothetical protein
MASVPSQASGDNVAVFWKTMLQEKQSLKRRIHFATTMRVVPGFYQCPSVSMSGCFLNGLSGQDKGRPALKNKTQSPARGTPSSAR